MAVYFDGFSTKITWGVRLVIIHLIERISSLSFKMNFTCANNEAQYETTITDLFTTKN